MKKKLPENPEVSFEEALGKLETIVKQLEKGDTALEELLAKFSEGVELSRLCLTRLNSAERVIDNILKQEKGQFIEQPFSVQEEE